MGKEPEDRTIKIFGNYYYFQRLKNSDLRNFEIEFLS
jgi:hypothetical protein